MKVQVSALFSYNNKIGSRIISWGTKHLAPGITKSPSHSAILVNNRWVHESTGHSGVRVISYPEWSKINKIAGIVELPTMEYKELANKFRVMKDKKYDYPGLFYLTYRVILTFIRIKLPKKNKWESKDKFFCTEVLGKLTGHYYGMTTPGQILNKLLNETHKNK